MEQGTRSEVRRKALDLLARREHSAAELSHKLTSRGCNRDIVSEIIAELIRHNLLSDARFAEAFVHQRIRKGCGPVRIRHELRERGVADDVIAGCVEGDDAEWMERIAAVRRKRFGESLPGDRRERARQARFLEYRGFSDSLIRKVLGF